jgi:hypothetical protein
VLELELEEDHFVRFLSFSLLLPLLLPFRHLPPLAHPPLILFFTFPRVLTLRRSFLSRPLLAQNPIYTESNEPFDVDDRVGFGRPEDYGEGGISPTAADLLESTAAIIRPLRTLTRITERRRRKGRKPKTALGEMDAFALLDQIDEQMNKAEDLETFLKVRSCCCLFPLSSSILLLRLLLVPIPPLTQLMPSSRRLLPASFARCALPLLYLSSCFLTISSLIAYRI